MGDKYDVRKDMMKVFKEFADERLIHDDFRCPPTRWKHYLKHCSSMHHRFQLRVQFVCNWFKFQTFLHFTSYCLQDVEWKKKKITSRDS